LKIYISQGSVTTQLRCGGIFNNHFTTNFIQICGWKNFENRLIFGEDMDKSLRLTFLEPPCIYWIVFPVLILPVIWRNVFLQSKLKQTARQL